MASALKPRLAALLESLPPTPPQSKLDELVKKTVSESSDSSSPENRKSQWEFLLKNQVFDLACTEGRALKADSSLYYSQLRDLLDVVLAFTEQEACEQTLPFLVLQDLLETQTIASCSHIFSWIEERASRLTEGLVPEKGKALILLRTLNDLLRRLSKMGSTTIFCGRILTFLSGVFPLCERSGVNLRGEYGPTWEGVKAPVENAQDVAMEEEEEKDKMQVDEEPKKAEPEDTKADFYNTFWSLQLPFSKPPLFAVIPVIKEATAKERAMMGSRAVGAVSLKRKREPDAEENSSVTEYFFAKFLTSPDLLDLEIADTHFRRQFLFQLAILLTHLQTFTKAAKSSWASSRNRSLQMDFTLEPPQAEWVQETYNKVMDELKQTTPNGRTFADTVAAILEREKNWVKWKNELCPTFDKAPWSAEIDGQKVDLEGATRDVRRKMREPSEEWPWRLGTEPLTEIWDMGYRDLTDLQRPFHAGDVKDFVKRVKQIDGRIALRQKKLAVVAEAKAAAQAAVKAEPPEVVMESGETPSSEDTSSPLHPSLPAKPGAAEAVPIPVVAPAPSSDDQIIMLEEAKQRLAWLALRTARDQHLQHFGKIGTGDIELLAKEIEIEAEKRVQDELAAGEEVGSASPASMTVSSKRVLVTGGAGYIGSHVIYTLQKTRRYKIVSLDNSHNSTPKSLERVSALSRSELPADASERDIDTTVIENHACDLTKRDEIRAVFEKYGKGGIWGVVHIAAYKAVGESVEIPLTYYENNVAATLYLLQVMNEYDCHRVVYSSSATVYGIPPTIPIPETTRLKADSPYGKTKVVCETMLDDLCHSDSKWSAISLRYFNPAGAHPSGMIGEDPKGRPGNLLPLLSAMAVGRVDASTLTVFGNDYPTPDGTCVRDYLHILDLAAGHLLALESLTSDTIFDPDARYKAYNLGQGRGISVLEIIEAMRKATGFDFKYEIIGRRRGDVPDLTADPALAEKELGFKANQDLAVMCRDLWNFQSKNPNGYDN
ncbi:THO complex subunit 1 transcription elongation factor-domain-containing protein [Roridomyces roridus]|uniref:THO complex subunit 1 transcription elongation factor-domain-containing protein n=1 Tax=Roridomyces roridus TaxID=1738132 RepID=A0AAD7F9N0_9AGAR|nr:THO complex subunit 1 transcription elongation factor-domain-containing protein [Roridomyces roridus]